MQDDGKQASDSRLPLWKKSSMSKSQSRYLRSPFSGNFSHFQRQILSHYNSTENSKNITEEKPTQEFDNQTDNLTSSAAIAGYDSDIKEPESTVTSEYLIDDNQPELEVESELNSGYETTVLFEPCMNESEMEAGLNMDIDIHNRIYALEERILIMEKEIQRMEEMIINSKNRGIVRLDGSMLTSVCGCSVCSVEQNK